MRMLLPLLLPALLCAACARDGTSYPSLAKRPVEAMDFSDPPEAPAGPVAPDPALDAQIAALRSRLVAVAGGFDDAAAKATGLARAPAARTVGSDAWLDAQSALAGLDDWRAQATAVATDAEGAGSARAATIAPPYPALETLQADAAREVGRQDAALRALQESLPGA